MLGKRKYNKKYFISILALILIFALCSSFVFAAKYTCKYAESWAPETYRVQSAYIFKEIVEQGSQGEIEVKVFPSAQLGTEAEVTDAVKMGSIQVSRLIFERVNKKFMMISMPFLFESWEQSLKIIDSPFIKRLKEEAKQNGFYIAGVNLEPPRHITNNKRPIEKPDDLKGLLLRVPPMDIMRSSMELLGATPQMIPYIDLYMSLKTGVVDGQENPLAQIKDGKFYEVQKYLSLVGYVIFPEILTFNLNWYESLPPEYQELIEYAAQVSCDYCTWSIRRILNQYETFLREKMITNSITPENHAIFVEKLKPLWQKYIDEGYFTQEDTNQVIEYMNN